MTELNELQISEELNNRLKHKGLYEDRINALERFKNTPKKNLKHGLGIRTDLEFIDYESAFNEGTTILKINGKSWTELNHRQMNFFKLNDFIHNGNIDEQYKHHIITHLRSLDLNSKSELHSSKLESLHRTLCNTYILAFEDKYTPLKHIFIEREITGNSYNHFIIIVGNNSNMRIHIKTSHEYNQPEKNHNSIITDFTDLIVGINSKVEIIEQRNLSERDVIYGRKRAVLDNASILNWINIDKDNKLSIIEEHIILSGEGSKSEMNNITCGKNSEYYLNNISEHIGKGTESLILNKSVLRSSKSIIKGLVKINDNASSSNGYQKSDALILDDKSRAISVPDLEIHNHDVKCTHGSTITRLDRDKVFYLMSRGIDRKDAETLLIEGFYDGIISKISSIELQEQIRKDING